MGTAEIIINPGENTHAVRTDMVTAECKSIKIYKYNIQGDHLYLLIKLLLEDIII